MGTCCDSRLQINFWSTPFFRAIELDNGPLSISIKRKENRYFKKKKCDLNTYISLSHQMCTFNSERNFFDCRIVAAVRAFEFRV
jgi:hypothetical protein